MRVLRSHGTAPFRVITTVESTVAVIMTIQVATRHPYAYHSESIQHAIAVARRLQEALATLPTYGPDLDRMIEMGWNTDLDELYTDDHE